MEEDPWPGSSRSPSSGPSAEHPSHSARWFGWRDDGDGMGQAATPVRAARPTQLLSHICLGAS
ncbi:MAG TPA: hypothetical protein VIH64_18090, partial [Streptosporangiaceae bacterium]